MIDEKTVDEILVTHDIIAFESDHTLKAPEHRNLTKQTLREKGILEDDKCNHEWSELIGGGFVCIKCKMYKEKWRQKKEQECEHDWVQLHNHYGVETCKMCSKCQAIQAKQEQPKESALEKAVYDYGCYKRIRFDAMLKRDVEMWLATIGENLLKGVKELQENKKVEK